MLFWIIAQRLHSKINFIGSYRCYSLSENTRDFILSLIKCEKIRRSKHVKGAHTINTVTICRGQFTSRSPHLSLHVFVLFSFNAHILRTLQYRVNFVISYCAIDCTFLRLIHHTQTVYIVKSDRYKTKKILLQTCFSNQIILLQCTNLANSD